MRDLREIAVTVIDDMEKDIEKLESQEKSEYQKLRFEQVKFELMGIARMLFPPNVKDLQNKAMQMARDLQDKL